MKQGIFTIVSNRELATQTYEMVLSGDASANDRPGQFVEVLVPGFFLRRPFAAATSDSSGMTLLYKVVGHGTEIMSKLQPGEKLDIITGLGNGFESFLDSKDQKPLLVAGGLGIAPIYALAEKLTSESVPVKCILGFNTATDALYLDELKALGVELYVATMDGTMGTKGFVTDVIREHNLDYSCFYTCGPLPMEKALCMFNDTPGEVSLEARMGCGYGMCMGCTISTAKGPMRVCKEGPVFSKEDIIW